jgi:hypothetical protein
MLAQRLLCSTSKMPYNSTGYLYVHAYSVRPSGGVECSKISFKPNLTMTIIMPPGDGPQGEDATRNEQGTFSVPAPVKRLFDCFPLLSYPPNEPPRRSPPKSLLSTLYIFTTDRDAKYGRPSFNPSCLRWQVSLANKAKRRAFAKYKSATDVSQTMWCRIPYSPFQQSLLAHWVTALPPPALTTGSALARSPAADNIQQAREMGSRPRLSSSGRRPDRLKT